MNELRNNFVLGLGV